ncbi:amino acid permease, variant [Truncatella angustata]|uniref:Amino acid permease, variant n=1 Tax=Truncatella angustata TaxID=152316 RepID=A0A9P8UWA9_9PEZI|nr:amino acid permease, variant [Truncatella angustata]KAH6659532.1 amino acid permease, variant [Truncatella angustata]
MIEILMVMMMKQVNTAVQHSQSADNILGVGSEVDSDNALLESIGYRQEFRREFTRWSTLSYAISIMGVLGSVPASWASPLAAGGPATAIWAWFSGAFFSLCIALSVAELMSAYPTSGGMYFVTKHVFPEDKVPLAAWIIGWSNFLGQTAGAASLGYSIAQMILAAVVIGSEQDDGTFAYTPTAEVTVALSIVILICHGIICSFSTAKLSSIIKWFAPINCKPNQLVGSVAISIALLVLLPNKPPASRVFGEVSDGSGWNSKGFSFLIGYLSVAWTMTDYDATGHISEELHSAAITGPVAIFQAVLVSWFFGWLLNIALGFGAGDVASLLSTQMGNPAAQVFYNAGGRRGGLVMWFWVILIQFFTGITALLADSRTCFALARDEALPFSSALRRMNSRTQTPLYSVWVVVMACCLMNLIGLGSFQTINGIYGVTAPAMDLSYIAVIAARMYYEKERPISKGPFQMGRWQKPINTIAIVWVLFISVILFFPPTYPVTPLNMNYAVAIAGFVALFAITWWYLQAKRFYTGPRVDDS